MCKPCKEQLKKYQKGGFGDSTFVNNRTAVRKYQDTGVVSAPTKTEERTINSDQFSTSNVLNALGSLSKGSYDDSRNEYTTRAEGLDSSLVSAQNDVANVRANILPNAREMADIASWIDKPGSHPAQLEFQEIERMTHRTDSAVNMTLGEQKARLKEMHENMSPELRKLFPNEGRSKNNDIFTFTSNDNSPLDGPPATAPYTLPMNDSLMCIGSVCGAYQEAGANIGVHTYNPSFREHSLAGRTGFTSIPMDQAEPGDLIQQAGRTLVNYRDQDGPRAYRPHHAGIIDSINENGNVSAYNSVGGSIGNFSLSEDFLGHEDGMAYRYTGRVPGAKQKVKEFDADAAALQHLMKTNPEISPLKSRIGPIENNFPAAEIQQSRQIPTQYTEPSNFWNRTFKKKGA